MSPTPRKRGAPEESGPSKSARRKISKIPQHYTTIIKIQVGDDEAQQTFSIHKELLVKHSEFFRAAVSKGWKENKTGIVHLPEQDPEIFQIFQHFLYTGQVCSGKDEDPLSRDTHGFAQPDDEYGRIANAWVLGETILSTSFKDAVVDALIVKGETDHASPLEMEKVIYPASSPKAKVRDLLIDIAVWEWDDATFGMIEYKDSDEFLFGLARALNKVKIEGRQRYAPYRGKNTCIYHEHGGEEICHRNMF